MDSRSHSGRRKSQMDYGHIYFWTATIYKWKRLLEPDKNKDVVILTLTWLINEGKIELFAYVIMPNHVHFIWRMVERNGGEMPHASFLKHTAHVFKKIMVDQGHYHVNEHRVWEPGRHFRFWKRDSLAILLDYPFKAYQKLNYLHNNPLQERWRLVKHPAEYKYSSAGYYERGQSGLIQIKDLRNEFEGW